MTGLFAATALLAQGGSAPPAPTLVVRDVTVISGMDRPPAPGMAVVIERGRIAAIRPSRGYEPARGARVIDATGKYLIPGLWDMHVHMSSRTLKPGASGSNGLAENAGYYLPLFVAWGVTGVRDMSGRLHLLAAWRDSVQRGSLIGPRMFITGQKVGGNGPPVPGAPYPLRSAADVRTTVRLLHDAGADFVKVESLSVSLLRELASESATQGLPFVGHLAPSVTLRDASRAGQRSFEHLDGVMLSVSAREQELRHRLLAGHSVWTRLGLKLGLLDRDRRALEIERALLASADPQRALELYRQLRRDGSWQVPTLSGLRDVQWVSGFSLIAEEARQYLPPLRRARTRTAWTKDSVLALAMFRRQLEIVGNMHRAGVPILAGTDTPGTERVPGLSMVDELSLLVQAGLSPLAALQAATRDPARFLGVADSLGTVAPGKVADLVLLDHNPLADIRHVKSVHAVALRGRYLSPADLAKLRAQARHLVAGWWEMAQ